MKNIFEAKQENSVDPEVRFAKECHKNSGLPLLPMTEVQEMDGFCNYVQIDKTVHKGIAESVKGYFQKVKLPIRQIYLVNNQLYADQFISIMSSLTPQQQNHVRSIIYGGKNEIDRQSFDYLV